MTDKNEYKNAEMKVREAARNYFEVQQKLLNSDGNDLEKTEIYFRARQEYQNTLDALNLLVQRMFKGS